MRIIQFRSNKEVEKALEYFKSKGMGSEASIARYAISCMFDREAPASYRKPEKLNETEEGRKICQLLGGHTTPEFPTSCTYDVYEVVGFDNGLDKSERTVPFSHLTQEALDTQYRPSKEKYLEVKNKLGIK